MSREDEVRRELEKAAVEQQCPVDGEVDAALGIGRTLKKVGVKVKKAVRNVRRATYGATQKEQAHASLRNPKV